VPKNQKTLADDFVGKNGKEKEAGPKESLNWYNGRCFECLETANRLARQTEAVAKVSGTVESVFVIHFKVSGSDYSD
jgi:hypothetical protein